MASWPSTLPQCPLIASRSEQQMDNRIVTNMDTGSPKIRKRYTAVPVNFDLSFVLTSDQYDTLITFYNDYISFDWVHPRTKVAASCRIMSNPSSTKVGDYYNVGFQLEVAAP